MTDRQKRFVNELNNLKETDIDLSFIPTIWRYLKMWVDNLDLHRTWMPVFRSVLSQVSIDFKNMITIKN